MSHITTINKIINANYSHTTQYITLFAFNTEFVDIKFDNLTCNLVCYFCLFAKALKITLLIKMAQILSNYIE